MTDDEKTARNMAGRKNSDEEETFLMTHKHMKRSMKSRTR